jgi:hypothetical protein|tara:strand:- start:12287 stop:13009 length:723 start_codon:yes stop_codon:yes gene_type:complete
MINDIRNTVLAVLNKNNYGYISPQDFNLYAQQAQMDLFEDYFYAYNYQVNKENQRSSGTGYADIKKGYAEVIDFFSVTINLTQNTPALNSFFLPSVNTTGSDYYLINKIFIGGTELERIEQGKILLLNSSPLTAPSTMFPAYTTEGNVATVYPLATEAPTVTCQYIRYPKVPKWTYVDLGNNSEPVFDQSQSDYQDFELFADDATDLTMKILQYAGVSIREASVVQYAGAVDATETNSEK